VDKVDKHGAICNALHEIYIKKNHDYGDSFGRTFKELGIISAVTRLYDKMNRIVSITKTSNQVKDESLRDTLLDLANYAIMTVIEMGDE